MLFRLTTPQCHSWPFARGQRQTEWTINCHTVLFCIWWNTRSACCRSSPSSPAPISTEKRVSVDTEIGPGGPYSIRRLNLNPPSCPVVWVCSSWLAGWRHESHTGIHETTRQRATVRPTRGGQPLIIVQTYVTGPFWLGLLGARCTSFW